MKWLFSIRNTYHICLFLAKWLFSIRNTVHTEPQFNEYLPIHLSVTLVTKTHFMKLLGLECDRHFLYMGYSKTTNQQEIIRRLVRFKLFSQLKIILPYRRVVGDPGYCGQKS